MCLFLIFTLLKVKNLDNIVSYSFKVSQSQIPKVDIIKQRLLTHRYIQEVMYHKDRSFLHIRCNKNLKINKIVDIINL
jgi:hypothetical protein